MDISILDMVGALYEDERLLNVKIKSKTTTDYSPRVVSFVLGQLLKFLDKEEQHVKVFLYSEDYQWAEVWLKREWDDSNSKRAALLTNIQRANTKSSYLSQKRSIIRGYLKKKGLKERGNFGDLVNALMQMEGDSIKAMGFGLLADALKKHKENYGNQI